MSETSPLTASIVVIGDEILGGFVTDTNSSWLAERLRRHGVELRHIATVPDEFEAIDAALDDALQRSRPHLILTSGGIGSTPDDITYEAIAASLGRRLVVAPEISHRVDAAITWTQSHGLDVDDEFADDMMRMARVPEGYELMRSSVGSFAPGIRMDVEGGIEEGGATIVVLPGVPSQLRAIVTEALEPDLLEGRGATTVVAEVTHGFPESVMNRLFRQLAQRFPQVKIGSYPGSPMIVRLRGGPEDVRAAREQVESYVADLENDPGGQRVREAWESISRGASREEPRGGQ